MVSISLRLFLGIVKECSGHKVCFMSILKGKTHCQDYPFDKITRSPFPNKPRFLRVCSSSLLKTLWE